MSTPDAGGGSRAYRRYVLGLLMVVYIFNFIDRQIVVILQESIKQDMGLSDAQLGLLSGFAFALFYVSFGIPIARWADRGNRRDIVALSLTVWSAMTVVCGLVGNYWQLLLARIGVGIGEAGGSPPAHSIISDYFPFEERGTALSIYTVGIYVGILIGFLAGGWINEFFGWRVAFFMVGLPGILLAIVVRLTLREPLRGLSDAGHTQPATERSMFAAIRRVMALRSFRYASLGGAFSAFVGYGSLNFMPSFLIRIHELPVGVVGTYLSLIVGIGGAIGTYASGWIADRLGRRDRRWYLWIGGWGTVIVAPLFWVIMLTDNLNVLWATYSIGVVFQALYLAPTIAAAHGLVGVHTRALASALVYFVLNIIGLGLGPLTVGIVSDLLAPAFGVESLRWALLGASQVGFVGGAFYFLAARHLLPELKQAAAANA